MGVAGQLRVHNVFYLTNGLRLFLLIIRSKTIVRVKTFKEYKYSQVIKNHNLGSSMNRIPRQCAIFEGVRDFLVLPELNQKTIRANMSDLTKVDVDEPAAVNNHARPHIQFSLLLDLHR